MRLSWVFIAAVMIAPVYAHTLRTESDFISITSALKTFQSQTGRYPSSDEGLKAMVERPPGFPGRWVQLMDRVPLDAWGHEYVYLQGAVFPGGFGLYTKGPDEFSATQGNDADDKNTWADDRDPPIHREVLDSFAAREFIIALPSALLGAAIAVFALKKRTNRPAVP